MQTVMCDGCGKQENTNIVAKNRDIKPVRFSILFDERSSVPNGTDRHEADLCGECRKIVENRYFRQKEGTILEIPSFLEVLDGAR